MRERGTVVGVRDGRVDVAIVPTEACASCGMCSEERGVRILGDVADPLGAAVGDQVEIETPLASRRRAEGLVYIAPVVAVIFGYLAGFLLLGGVGVNPDAAGAVIGIGAGIVTFLAMRFFGRDYERTAGNEPQLRAIIARGNARRTAQVPPADPPIEEETTRE